MKLGKILFISVIVFGLIGCNSAILEDTIKKLVHDGVYHDNAVCPYEYIDCFYW